MANGLIAHNCQENCNVAALSNRSIELRGGWKQDTITWWADPKFPDFLSAVNVGISRWEPWIRRDFKRVDSPESADIVAQLGRIDGANQVLAFAYFPTTSGSRAGDMIFDAVDFQNLSHEGRVEVAAHEIGHSIGIRHHKSKRHQRALMAPNYNGPRNGLLSRIDIKAAQKIYGPR